MMGYVRGADGELVAQYEYGPFGELLRATGPLSHTFTHLFSTKYHDWETGFYYYGHRYYSPTTGRWLSRDPIEELGGLNLYGCGGNNPINSLDLLGLKELVLQYDLAPDGIAPFGVKKVSGLSELLADAQRRVGDCDCIKLLRVGAHGYPGSINDNGNPGLNIADSTFRAYELAKQNTNLLQIQNVQKDVQIVEALRLLSRLMCKEGKIEFISCSSFAGEEGRQLHRRLEGIFGEGNVKGYAYPVKWGLFGTVHWVTP